MPESERLLTDKEQKVFELLGEAFNQFVALPVLHKSDQTEFAQAIHVAQNIVLARPAMRGLKDKSQEQHDRDA